MNLAVEVQADTVEEVRRFVEMALATHAALDAALPWLAKGKAEGIEKGCAMPKALDKALTLAQHVLDDGKTSNTAHDCAAAMAEAIRADAADVQARRGELYQTSTTGQTVKLGG